jgi:outer membrane protein assembly factor BamE (lipoprotein component of BamABCDE complex)
MKKLILIVAAMMLLLSIVACNAGSRTDESKEKDQTESEVQHEKNNDDTSKKDEGTESIIEQNENEQDSKNNVAIFIAFEPYTESFAVNGIFLGDTAEHVIEILGEPTKRFGNERYDYHFQDALYGENMMVVFDDISTTYIQANTSTEDGKLLTKQFIENFPGNIYVATKEFAKHYNAQSISVYLVNANSILIIEKHTDENAGISRTYMFAPDYSFSYARGWDMSTFEDVNKFTKVDSATAIKVQ